ncbi:hypothetical protein QYE76_049546 [Lolium multiflorum]|uniref:Uncharacterized protein n=1 Tax=Lolium multiflorum TaxID=4521 RepID=A0AAD8WG58_LOLMU|nr:hypothetical protein QYE76_049546 [Lolium multiflorum]
MASYSSLVSHKIMPTMQALNNPMEKEEEEEEGAAAAPAAATVEDAMGYVEAVKVAFKDHNPAMYHEFLRVMDDFRNHRIGIAEVASRVKALFRDSPGLLLGFNAFLPKGYKIQVVGVDELAACFVRDVSLDDDDGH